MFKTIKEDFSASLVVFFVALPLCLGIALASGAPLMSGLVAGVVGGIVAGAISGSRLGVSGPAAGMAVIVLGSIESLGFEAFLLTVVLAGFLQILLGLAKAGTLGNYFPSSVIKGMLSGIGIIIILKQLPYALGIDGDTADGGSAFSNLANSIHPTALFITAASIALMLAWEQFLAPRFRLCKMIPGALVAVLFGIAVQVVCQNAFPGLALSINHLVNVPITSNPSEISAMLGAPDWSQLFTSEVLTTAIIIAVVGSLETLLSVEAIDKLDPRRGRTPANRELFAQGGANIVSGLLGGLPVTQVIVRGSANIQSGAQSKMSTIMHGFLLLISVLTLPGLLNLIPLSVLASVLILTGYKLAKPALFISMYQRGKEQFVPFVATIAGVVFTDLLTGISIGMTIAIITVLYRNFINSHLVHTEQDENSHVITLRLCEEVSFLNKNAIIQTLDTIPEHASVTIDASKCFVIDNDVADSLHEFMREAKHRHIKVTLLESESPLAKPRLSLS